MPFIAFALLIVSLTKLILVASSSNKLEVKELVYNTPILVDSPPGLATALLTADGLIGLVCSLFLLLVAL